VRRVWRELPRPLVGRFVRYTLGSGLATVTSAAVFAIGYRVEGAQVATLAAFLSGTTINFLAGRFWAWDRRTPLRLGRDLASFLTIAVASALIATAATTVTDTYARRSAALTAHLAIVVEAAYLATYAALFLVKFAVLDRVVFRSRSQVETTTRA
jgi:putative flippase GtrA